MTAPRSVTSFAESNGIRLRVTEVGSGPLVILLHGWPELAYSWRHQLPFVADIGFRAVAIDLRGCGGSHAPRGVREYDIFHLRDDVLGLLDAYDVGEAVLVGHEWGAQIAYACAVAQPERIRGLVTMSVPYVGRGRRPPLELLRTRMRAGSSAERFHYLLYFQEPGRAEVELDPVPAELFRRLFTHGATVAGSTGSVVVGSGGPHGGLLDQLGEAHELPPWMTAEELEVYASAYRRSGFGSSLSWYRNLQHDWEASAHLIRREILQPSLFVAGTDDLVVAGSSAGELEVVMRSLMPGLDGVHLLEGIGHWVQQEAPKEVNSLLGDFLDRLHS